MKSNSTSTTQSRNSASASNLALRHIENRIEELSKLVFQYANQISELKIILAIEQESLDSTREV